MPAVCFYFQVHQPFRLRRYRHAESGTKRDYFDDSKNALVLRKVADKCYLPANRKILELIRRYHGQFRVAYSITGTAIDQMRLFAPDALASFQELSATGAVEFLGETAYHTLASIFDADEFREQVTLHGQLMEREFGQKPRFFRNTELIYNDQIGAMLDGMGFCGIITEGADDILDWRSPNYVYRHPERELRILAKNYRLSDDIAFRFSNRSWPEWPLTAPKFASWVHQVSGNGVSVNLFMDYETFGEHQWEDTGIFNFLNHLPEEIFKHPDWCFLTPSEVIDRFPPVAPLSYGRLVSWADLERDITAWKGNEMQEKALHRIYSMRASVLARNNPATTRWWRRLQTSDHFYYMCTKWFSDGDVHAYFSPFKSPYEAFLSYMNVLDDFEQTIMPKKIQRPPARRRREKK